MPADLDSFDSTNAWKLANTLEAKVKFFSRKKKEKEKKRAQTLFFSHWAFWGQSLAIWSLDLQMKQLSPGFIPGTLSGCFLRPFLVGLVASPGDFGSTFFLRLKFFFVFLFGSFGGVGSGLGNSSGWEALNLFRASLCLLLTIFVCLKKETANLEFGSLGGFLDRSFCT